MNDTAHDSENLADLDDAALEQRREELQRDIVHARNAIADANRVIEHAQLTLDNIVDLLDEREVARQKQADSLGTSDEDADMDAKWAALIRDEPVPASTRDRASGSQTDNRMLRFKAASIVALGLLVGLIVGPSLGHDWRWTLAFPLGCALVAGWFASNYYDKHNDRSNDTN